ncbi:hypothetical protein SAMN05216548_10793 [Faunimonas pinastri]|uniref:Uncharacterized protein n=1 Tax=Faunimonas pinastri TaxID=1855383 RepID=A0A1H9IFZ9_9HYPH|nr:hypothetical protein [Faunimonas pinastri]SEQ73457.1 hypothetical protein SAMN05216548_10793 [Faunimonas pinastri]
MDVFAEAASSADHVMEVDLLNGAVVRGTVSENLASAVAAFAEAPPRSGVRMART